MKILQSIEKYQSISNLSSLQILGELSDKLTHEELLKVASALRDEGFGNTITFSKKIFIPLTNLCRDVCHYCTFAKTPKKIVAPYMTIEEVVKLAERGKKAGCKEALFTLGEKPELRYRVARDFLFSKRFKSTTDYLIEAAKQVFEQTGLLPHLNPGTISDQEATRLREVGPSMGMMLESASDRLTKKGMAHYGSPDKVPSKRIDTLITAGRHKIPFTTGILIGIGETRLERIESLLEIKKIHEDYGHIQEIIVQNFRAKPNTIMQDSVEPDFKDLQWTIALARLIFGPKMSIQVPPNLSPGELSGLVAAGINDWGGVSPLTPDHVNPEAPWPHLDKLYSQTEKSGKTLVERLTAYPKYIREPEIWLDKKFRSELSARSDSEGLARQDNWYSGESSEVPERDKKLINAPKFIADGDLLKIFSKVEKNVLITKNDILNLFASRGKQFSSICSFANELREEVCGDIVSFVVNRNINYTNVCYFKCQFCAFSKGKMSENLRGKPYNLSGEEIKRRVREAWERGASEVCMQGGIHPHYTGETYLEIVKMVKEAVPDIHLHAFSPLEIWQGAATNKISINEFLLELKRTGLDTLPGTAAEILDDSVRKVICADKINTEQWIEVMRQAHSIGFKTTSTIMYGHVETSEHWANHLLAIRDLQIETGGFTEFVPLPFVAEEAPIFLKGKARKGPTFRETILMHAVARILFFGAIDNIQASWVKMGHEAVVASLQAGVNDLGGTLMNESITRAAGASHGQETHPELMLEMINSACRTPRLRNTLYEDISPERFSIALKAKTISPIINEMSAVVSKNERNQTRRRGLIKNSALTNGLGNG